MAIITPKLKAFFARARRILPLSVEIMVTLTSFWVAFLLFRDQSYFDIRPGWFNAMSHSFVSKEWEWACLAMFAAVTKTIGMAISVFSTEDHDLDASFLFRLFGWMASAFLWSTVTLSILASDPLQIGIGLTLTFVVISLGALISGPEMPDDWDQRG